MFYSSRQMCRAFLMPFCQPEGFCSSATARWQDSYSGLIGLQQMMMNYGLRVLLQITYKIQIENMGGQTCGGERIIEEDPLALNYDEDKREAGVNHQHELTCSNQQVEKILLQYTQMLRTNNSMPIDPIILKSKTNEFECMYERPYKFMKLPSKLEPYKLIDDYDSHPSSISVKDEVMQYFGAFLCFLADKPSLIRKIICTGENTYGVHSIEAYRNGRVVNLLIDDYILCREMKGRLEPVFSQPQKEMYLWPCILEKAWFKLKGNSAKRVEQNTPEEVFETFMPLPMEKHLLIDGPKSNSKEIVARVFSGSGQPASGPKGFICKSKRNPQHDIGLSGAKYYYLLDTFTFEGKRMFLLRNPCGQPSFRGVYDDIPARLQQFIENRSLHNSPGNGNFLLDEEEFVEQMSEIVVVHYTKGYKISLHDLKFQCEQEFFLGFELKSQGPFNVCVIQHSQAPAKNKSYHPLSYQVIRLSDMKMVGGFDNKQGCFGAKNTYLLDNFNEESTSPSNYIIRLKKKETQNNQRSSCCLVVYFKDEVKFDIASQNPMQQKWKQFLGAEGERKLSLVEAPKSQDVAHVVCWIGDVAFIYVQKLSKRPTVSIEVNFPELMNLNCISHPGISRSSQWNSYSFADKLLIVFEKVDLTAQTHIRQYFLEGY